MNPLLQVTDLRKHFPPNTTALDGADLTVGEGEVHCLLGANGAGKSTLLKVLAGVYRPNGGEIRFGGAVLKLRTPQEATTAGITMIYQELDLVPELTVEENLYLGHAPSKVGFINRARRSKLAREVIARVGGTFPVNRRVGELSIANQQLTAIARSLTLDARLIIMDEPSAALTEEELQQVFKVIQEITDDERSVLYVSHRLKEVLDIGDKATVLRDGQTVATFDLDSATEQDLAGAMVGEHNSLLERVERVSTPQDVTLRVEKLSGPQGLEIRDFAVRNHQIVGLYGLNGAGRTTFLKALFGDAPFKGNVTLQGKSYHPTSPRAAIRAGVGLVPENRKTEGLLLGSSLYTNVTLPTLRHKFLTTRAQLVKLAEPILQKLGTKFSSIGQHANQLSGGNQQKVVLAKWLLDNSQLLLLDEPSRGLDIGAKADLYALIRKLADAGATVIIASSELEELYVNCDAIWVVHEGKNTELFDPATDAREDILHATITGIRRATA